ncbi:NADP-dependent oxidoreductase domain-containing protein [Rhodocollybia butyracea]|uniref:NADP-dependent oxidoreductase domain-containing protein n=1 Tax=Rhodocollybia butyracea TaxID=206335 RepID=A0A9P5U1V6_9AGAR|nr:NADP-dependent oxidoreductase domain-containing protein [Rhodocollybia butyracea]
MRVDLELTVSRMLLVLSSSLGLLGLVSRRKGTYCRLIFLEYLSRYSTYRPCEKAQYIHISSIAHLIAHIRSSCVAYKRLLDVFNAPPPPTKLGLYRILSPRAGVRVSPICLGAMSIGDRWNSFMGSMDREASFKLLDAYFDMGGNFIDTSNNYQDESSEEFIGEWMEERGNRDQMVVATKYTTCYKTGDPNVKQKINYTGNNAKSLHISVEASLKKLRTSYIDILYMHWWDWDTSVEEVMDSLHNVVASGKVIYLGVSDTPAWVVAQANQYAKDHGKTPFVIYEGKWNIMDRSFERDIIPMARSLGLALAPWSVLASSKLRTDAEEQRHNLEALDITLSDEQIKEFESVVPFDVGFPIDFIGDGTEPNFLFKTAGNMVKIPRTPALRPQ